MIRKTIAFTLAETLIVMGIIGVVSALTLPNLNSSTGEKEKVAKVKKIYQNLDDALGRAQAVYGPIDEWFSSDDDLSGQVTKFSERITEFMKLSKTCGLADNQGCFTKGSAKHLKGTSSYKNLDEGGSLKYYKFVTADGTSIAIVRTNYVPGGLAMVFYVDIDGSSKGQYTYGKDIFSFEIFYKDSMLTPMRASNFSQYLSNLKQDGTGTYASGWVIDYDNMDYLKLNSEGKCPNGITPTEQNPRCK